jgi:triosephosphate isomerase
MNREMRTPLVAGNWKMNMTIEAARSLVFLMSARLREIQGVEKVLCPPFVSLQAVHALLEGSDLGLAAQNMYWEEKGAYTGEVSPLMVKELCNYVLLGHSERRSYFGETDETVNRKMRAAEKYGLIPIFCFGETLQEYESGRTAEVVSQQVKLGLFGLAPHFSSRIILAYEPVWAIGTGKASTGQNANDVVGGIIRPALGALFGQEISQTVRVLYGGSVTASNAREFFDCPEIDGALVGGASLKADDFVAINQA